MKIAAVFSLVLAPLLSAQAAEWRKVFECGSERVVIDSRFEGFENSPSYQLVIRDSEAVAKMIESGVLPKGSRNSRGEVIRTIRQNFPDYFTDFSYLSEDDAYAANDGRTRVYRVLPSGTTLTLEAFEALRFDPRAPYVRGERIGGWTFTDCRSF